MSGRAHHTGPSTPGPSTPPDSSSSNETPQILDLTQDDASDTDSTGELAADKSPSPSTRATANFRSKKQKLSNIAVKDDGLIQDCIDETEESNVNSTGNGLRESPEIPRSLLDTPSYGSRSRDTHTKSSTSPSQSSASHQPVPIWKLEKEIKKIIQKDALDTDRKDGFAYIYGHEKDEAGFFKVGNSQDPHDRKSQHEQRCKLSGFILLKQIPEGQAIQWSRRLESLVKAELGNMKHSFDCICSDKHREYFVGNGIEGVKILTAWGRWLELEPYDRYFKLTPFWQDRLDLLQKNNFHHPLCSTPECSSKKDVLASSCQDCLRLRLAAWAEVTAFDYFEYECRMRVAWESVRRFLLNIWQKHPDGALRLMSCWEKIQPSANFLWAQAILPYVFLFAALQMVPSSGSLVAICLFVHWMFITGWNQWAYEDRLAKEAGVMPNPNVPRTPQSKTPQSVKKSGTSGSKERPGSINEPIRILSHPQASTIPKSYEQPRSSRAATLSPGIHLTENRASEIIGKGAKKAKGKRRKSGTDIATVTVTEVKAC